MKTVKNKIWISLAFISAVLITAGCIGRIIPRTGKKSAPYTVLQEREDRIVVKLPNRLIAIAQRMPAAPVASAQIRVETGSIYEQEYVGAGISHFLEHLLSGGSTTTRSEKETNEILGQIGARKNAATGLDSVFYYLNTPGAHAITAVDLLSDWMLNSTLPENEFNREREVIQREISMGESEPGRIFWRLTQQARYEAHPGRHPTIGYTDEFLRITRDQLVDFYERMYVPNNMVFTVAGDIDPREVVERIARNFSQEEAKELPEIEFPDEPDPRSPRTLTGRADITKPRIRLAWPGTEKSGEHDYALNLLAEIIGRGETARLKRKVRDELQLVTSISSYNLSFSWGEGFFGVDAQPREGKEAVDEVIDEILNQIQELRQEKVSQTEIDRTGRNIMARVYSANQKVQETASRLASDTLATGDPDYLLSYLEEIRKLTPVDLKEAARKYLTPERMITVKLLPETEDHRAEPLKRKTEKEITDFPWKTLDVDNRRLIDNLVTKPGEEYKRDPVETGEYRLFEMENGIRLITQRSNIVPQVAVHIYLKGGMLGEEPGREGLSSAVTAMMDRGTENYSADEFAEAVENMGASVNAAGGYNTDYVRSTSLSEDWERVMELTAELLLRPTFPRREWQKMQPRLLARIDRRWDNWYGELTEHFREEYFKDHPWSQALPGRRDTVEDITVEDLRNYHRNRLKTSGAVIAVTGDIEPQKVFEKVRRLFISLESKEDPESFSVPEAPDPGLRQVTTAKPVTAVKMGLGPAIERFHEDYQKMRVLSNLISDFPSGWLQQALRGEGGGLVYASWGRLVTGLVPGYFEITFNTSPDDAPKALDKTAKVIRKARTEDISEKDLQRAKSKAIFEEFSSRQSNSQRAMEVALAELYGLKDYDGRRLAGEIQRITPDDIQKIAKERLDRVVTILMSSQEIDEEKIPPSLVDGNFTK